MREKFTKQLLKKKINLKQINNTNYVKKSWDDIGKKNALK